MNFYNIDQNLGEKKIEGVFGMNCLYIYIHKLCFFKINFFEFIMKIYCFL